MCRDKSSSAAFAASGFGSLSPLYTRAYIKPTREASCLSSWTTVRVYMTYHTSSARTPIVMSVTGASRRMGQLRRSAPRYLLSAAGTCTLPSSCW